MKKGHVLLLLWATLSMAAYAQKVAVKTNLLYGVYTFTPNLGLEWGISHKTTLDFSGGYNPWKINDKGEKKAVHWLAEAEYRYWLCERFNGHFFGAHILGSQFNINRHSFPLLLGKNSGDYRFEGYAVGGGISYGYHWLLGNRWNLEANIGVGYVRLVYDKFSCKSCGEKLGREKRDYLGPTRAAVSIIYIIK